MRRLLDFIVGREPVATATGVAGGVAALAGVLTAFDLVELDAEQIAAIAALAAWTAGYLARRVVSPVVRTPLAVVALVVAGLLALVPGPARADNSPCEGDCSGRQKRGCAEAQAECSDDDQVTVIVCTQPDSCSFHSQTTG